MLSSGLTKLLIRAILIFAKLRYTSNAMRSIRLLLLHDNTICREGIRCLLHNRKDVECVAAVGNGEEAISLVKELIPDILLISNYSLPVENIEVIKQIRTDCPTTAVLVLTHNGCYRHLLAAMNAGASGYLFEDISVDDLIDSIRVIHDGKSVFDLESTKRILHSLSIANDKNTSHLGELHNREMEILRLASRGMGNKSISRELSISDRTVATHFSHIFGKLGVQSRTEAVSYALKQGWITTDDLFLPPKDDYC